MPDIFAYSDHRIFLREWYEWKKSVNPRFSYRILGEKVGFRSPGFFTQILQGKTTMSLAMVHGFADFMGLGKRETEYFQAMVLHNQARSLVEAKRHLDIMVDLRPEALRRLERDKAEFLEEWHHIAVWQLLEAMTVGDDTGRIASSLVPPVQPEEVRRSLELLDRLGLARRDSEGRWRQIDPVLSVDRGIPRATTRRFYLSMNRLAAEAVDRFEQDDRLLSWVTLAISDKKRTEIVQEIRAFRRHLVELARRDDSPQDVHQLLIQLFPLSRTRHPRLAAAR